MAWMKSVAVAELTADERKVVEINGEKILLLQHQNDIHAVQHNCPHMKLPLQKGKITDDCAIVCPFHKSAFDLKTGDVKAWSPWPPLVGKVLGMISREKALKVYPTKVEDAHIWVDVAE